MVYGKTDPYMKFTWEFEGAKTTQAGKSETTAIVRTDSLKLISASSYRHD